MGPSPKNIIQLLLSTRLLVTAINAGNGGRGGSDRCNCTLLPLGRGRDDAPRIANIILECSHGGKTVCFPAPYVYTIGSAMETYAENVHLLLEGTFQYTSNLTYWMNNSFPVELQSQLSAWRFHGNDFVLDGGDDFLGMIDGNGQAWYTYSAGGSNTPGRPMTLDIYNATNGVIRNLYFFQAQFWTMIVEMSKNITIENIEVHAENNDPHANGTNWVQNVDGLDMWRSSNVTIHNFTYNAGDDCIAFKGNSSSIHVSNITCLGGPGIAFGSVGQYSDMPDYISNIDIDDVYVQRPSYAGVGLGQGTGAAVYFKSWIGVPFGTPPNGGGGGTGAVANISISNVWMKDVDLATYINSCLSYVLAINASANPYQYCNTSTLTYSNITFNNLSGTTEGTYRDIVAQLNCSSEGTCTDLKFANFGVEPRNVTGGNVVEVDCQNVDSISGVSCS